MQDASDEEEVATELQADSVDEGDDTDSKKGRLLRILFRFPMVISY